MIMKTELTEFMNKLKANKKNLSGQQFRTIKGQAFAGDIAGAEKDCISCWRGGLDNGKDNNRDAAGGSIQIGAVCKQCQNA